MQDIHRIHTFVRTPRWLLVSCLLLAQCAEAPDSANFRSQGSSESKLGELSTEEQAQILQASAEVARTFEVVSDSVVILDEELTEAQTALPGSGFNLE